MHIAIITPCHNEPPAWLAQCAASVASQNLNSTHILINDGGHPITPPPNTELIHLPVTHGNYGDTARAIGAVSAAARNFDALAFLDADNWFLPNHLRSLLDLHEQTHADVCSSSRLLYHPDGQLLGKCPEVDGENFVDTNCLLLFRPAFTLLPVWFLMPPEYHVMGDRLFWRAIKQSKLTRAYTNKPTVAYRTTHRLHYDFFGVEPPTNAKDLRFTPTPIPPE